METVAKKRPRRRRSFTTEFKSEIVEARNRGDRSIGQVAPDFHLSEPAVRECVKQADIDAGRRDGQLPFHSMVREWKQCGNILVILSGELGLSRGR